MITFLKENHDIFGQNYVFCVAYDISLKDFMDNIKTMPNYENLFFNGEVDEKRISFDVMNLLPDEIVNLFKRNKDAFVMALREDYKFAATSLDNLTYKQVISGNNFDLTIFNEKNQSIGISTDDLPLQFLPYIT